MKTEMTRVAWCVLAIATVLMFLVFSLETQADQPDDYSLSFWIKMTGPIPEDTVITPLYAGPHPYGRYPQPGLFLYDPGASDSFSLCWVDRGIYTLGGAWFGGRPDDPPWFHFVVTMEEDKMCVWVNGTGPTCLQNESTARLPAEEDVVDRDDYGWSHRIDDLRIFRGYVVSPEETEDLYAEGCAWDADGDGDVDGSDLAAQLPLTGDEDLDWWRQVTDEFGREEHHE